MIYPDPFSGSTLNRRATVGSLLVQLRAQIPSVAKQARKTPPKIFEKEWEKVREVQRLLPILEAQQTRLQEEWSRLIVTLGECPAKSLI